MTWEYWITLYIRTHCASRGLRSNTMAAYDAALRQFRAWIEVRHGELTPQEVSARIVLEYVLYLRQERDNGDSAVNRTVTVFKNFYRAMVAMGHLEPDQNPLAQFPKLKAAPRKLPTVLSADEVRQLLDTPPSDTVLGLRDRAVLALLYGTGIRASECATLIEGEVDLSEQTIKVTGKGGHQRVLPLTGRVVDALAKYRTARGSVAPTSSFFRSRRGKRLSRNAVYERVRKYAGQARLTKHVTPHTLRHTFATHLVRVDTNLVVIRDLLGHRQLTSTQVYLHLTVDDLRKAVRHHPVERLAPTIERLLPDVKLPFQRPREVPNTG
jgi:integrase/recombinase XerD